MKFSKCKGLTALLVIVALITLNACGNGAKTNDEPIRFLLDWFPNVNHSGLYVALDQGYYSEEGLAVDIMQAADGSTAQLLATGQGEFGISYQEDVCFARSENLPVVAIATVIQHNTSGFAAPVEKNIKTPADFSGKVYGGWGSPAESATLKTLMEQYGADFATLEMVNIGSTDFFTAIASGSIDFAWIYYGVTGVEAELRGQELDFIRISEENDALDYYTPIIISSEQYLQEHPETARKFLRATARGYQYCIENPEAAADILIKYVPEQNAELIRAGQQYLTAEYQADAEQWGLMQANTWQAYADFLYQNELIKEPLDIKAAFSNDYLPQP